MYNYILIHIFVFMIVNEKVAKAISYISGINVKSGEVSKDILLDHDFAKSIFGDRCSSGMFGGKPDWQSNLETLVLYTNEELSNFFINYYNHKLMICKFKELGIDFSDGHLPSACDDGEIYFYKEHYDYFEPLYDYLISLGFKLDRVYRSGAFKENHSIYMRSEELDISFRIKDNSFHANYWTIDMSGHNVPEKAKEFTHGYASSSEILYNIKKNIEHTIKSRICNADAKDTRNMKLYMLLNDIEEFNIEEYLKYLEN